jgi:hypothetical protein
VRQAVQPADHFGVLLAGEVVVDGGGLARQADLGAHGGGVGADVDAADAGGARIWWQQGGQDADEGGLAGAVGTEQAVDAAPLDGQGEAVQRTDLAAEGLDEALGLDDGVVHEAPQLVYSQLYTSKLL